MAMVRCPKCGARLELEDRHLGHEVDCGECRAAFVARPEGEVSRPAGDYRPVSQRSVDPDDEGEPDDRPRGRVRGGGSADRYAVARAKVRPPAIGLIVVGAISFLMIGVGIIQYGTMPAQFEAQNRQIDSNPQLQPAQKQQMKDVMKVYQNVVMRILPITWGLATMGAVVTIIGGVKMMSLSGRGWGMAGSIVAMLPCVSGCCLLGLPIGIWAIVVLGNPDVKAAFAATGIRPPGVGDGSDDLS